MLNLGYLFDPRPGLLPPHDLHLQLALMALLAVGVGASLFWSSSRRQSPPMQRALLCLIALSLLLLGLMSARLLSIPFLSMRVLFYAVASVSLGGWAAYLLATAHRSGFLKRQLGVLAFAWGQDKPVVPTHVAVGLLLINAVGLILIADHLGRSYAWIAALFLLLLSPQLLHSLWVRKWLVHLETMTPLWFAYAAAAARRLCAKFLTQPLPLYDGFAYPEPVSSLLNIEAIFLASAIYVLLCQGYLLSIRANRAQQFPLYAAAALLTVSLVWSAAEYFGHRTHGVTANDPYAYTQMAVDIAQQGHPMHRFPLFPRISNLGISWWPVVHYGYQVRVPPLRGDGSSASDFPPGWPVLLSTGYLLLGESGLYLTNPMMGLLSLAALVALVAEILHDRPWGQRLLGGAFAAFALATSYEQVDRLLVPMADASAQLFTTLTLFCILRGMRRKHRLYAILGGLCFGWAYFIRHTQLVLVLCVPIAVLVLSRDRLSAKQRCTFVGLFGLCAFLVAIPDLLYHQFVFGHFLTPESTELDLFSVRHIPSTARLIWERLLSGNEFGFLLPLIVYGAYRMFRERTGEFLVLVTAVVAILLVHLPYAALRLRDLLSLFPLLLAWAAYGVVALWRQLPLQTKNVSYGRYAQGMVIVLVLVLLPAFRTWPILPRPRGEYRASFGYMSAEERRAFDLLAQLTQEGSVIGSSLNGGPIDLYSGRQSFRPAFWSEEELEVFLNEMFGEATAVYILDDGEMLKPSLQHAEAHHDVVGLVRLAVPIFGNPEHVSGVLYQVRPRSEVSQ